MKERKGWTLLDWKWGILRAGRCLRRRQAPQHRNKRVILWPAEVELDCVNICEIDVRLHSDCFEITHPLNPEA